MEGLADATVGIISQYISVSNQHVVYVKVIQCCMSLYLKKAVGKK